MTEYDFSPEAYERYLATQTRIAKWVDKTEQHRDQFQDALSSGSSPARHGPTSYAPHNRLKKSPPPPSHYQHHGQSQPPRQLFIHPPPPESESSEGYGDGPGPMPLPSQGMMYAPQPQQAYNPMMHPMGQSMMSPPPMMMPPTYMMPPPHKSSHRRHRSHSRSRSHYSPAYYSMASPPVSPGYQYAYPPMGGVHPGYIMMAQQPHHRGGHPSMMSDLPQPPRSAPANVTTFSNLLSPPATAAPGGYFDPSTRPSGTFMSPPLSGTYPAQTSFNTSLHGAGSTTSHSTFSNVTGSMTMGSPPQTPYYMGMSMPQYQGIQSAMASPTYFGPAQPPAVQQSLIVPQGLHQRVYDLSTGSNNKHYLRHSVG